MIIAVGIITFIGFHLNREFHHGNNVKSQKKPCSFRENGLASIENEPATRMIKGSRLRVLCLAHLLTVIFSCEISTRISVLHLEQYSGKLYITASSCTFVRVLHPQIGQ